MRAYGIPIRFVAVAAFSMVSMAHAVDLQEFGGTWAMKLGQRNLFVLTLMPEGDAWRGTFERPPHFESTNGAFSEMGGGLRRDRVVRTRLADGALHLTVQNANDTSDEDSYVMAVQGNRAELMPDDLPPGAIGQPYLFERASAGAVVASDWEPHRLYVPGDSDAPSAEMKAIFDEDQRVRTGEHIDWNVVGRSDAGRRAQTRKLLETGALHTAQDYREAAFVFQHAGSAQDYLLAHTLAMVAVAKGEATAIWIAAATLDRYLKQVGQKQIFGTQYFADPKEGWTQEPYDRELVSDALRQQLGVPSQAVQAQQLKAYRTQH